MAKAGSIARAEAAKAMTAVTKDRVMLRDALSDKLPPQERARAARLATEALRWAARSDRLLGPHLRMKPEDEVMNLLRLAIYEIYVDGAPGHAAVDGAVDLARKSKRGLVNGVLRNVLRTGTDWDSLGAPKLPKWLRKPLNKAWGKATLEALETAHAADMPLDVTLKDAVETDRWAKELNAEVLPNGSLRLEEPGQITNLPGFAEGAWWVQDAGATIAAKALDPRPGERVLDLCAAPGGKTMQLAAAGAVVTALDISGPRLKRLDENLARTGLSADVITTDALHWTPDAQFDAVLLDAPCSATGTLRRHPDLAYAKDGSELEGLTVLQAQLLDKAWEWVKPEGRLIYCTCSLFPDEGEMQIAEALKRHSTMQAILPNGSWIDPAWPTDGLGLRLRPDQWATRGGIDGFFVARLEKQQ